MNAPATNGLHDVDIRRVADRLGLALTIRSGETYTHCPNPEHGDEHPSCHLGGDEPHLFYCHGCTAAGDPVALVKLVSGCDTAAAFQWLRDRGFILDSRQKGGLSGPNAPPETPQEELARRRGWTVEAMEALGVEADGRNVRFPMRDAEGNVTGWKSRRANNATFAMADGSDVKAITNRGGQNGLFYPDCLHDAPDPVLVVEGEADALAALSAGHRAVIGTAGAATGEAALAALKTLTADRDVVLAPDPDDAGRGWRDRLAEELLNVQARVRYIPPADTGDLDDQLRTGADLGALIKDARTWTPPAADLFDGKTFIPLRLARALSAGRRLCYGYDPETGAGRLMEYRGGVWHPARGLEVQAQNIMGEEARPYRVRQGIETLELDVPRHPWQAWNPHRRLVNCKSGMLNPVNLELRPHRPEDYSTFQVEAPFDPAARSNVVEAFLEDVLPGDAVDLALQIIGYLLVPDLSADKFFVLEGPAGTGKTTLLDAVLGLVGPGAWASVTLHDLAENRFAAARLENKLVGAFDDLDAVGLKTASQIKALTGGHPWLTVERKGYDAYKAPLYARLIFTCNEMPRSPDKSQAWLDRLCLIPFANHFRGEDREDKHLGEKLATPKARAALLALAVAALNDLASNGWRFPQPQSLNDELSEYRTRNDSVAAFVEECCTVSPHAKAERGAFYAEYKAWCEAAGLHPVSRRNVYGRLRDDYGCGDYQAVAGTRYLTGIGLAAGSDE